MDMTSRPSLTQAASQSVNVPMAVREREVELPGCFILPTLAWSAAHLDALCFSCESSPSSKGVGSAVPSTAPAPAPVLLAVVSCSKVAVHPEDLHEPVRIAGVCVCVCVCAYMPLSPRLSFSHTTPLPPLPLLPLPQAPCATPVGDTCSRCVVAGDCLHLHLHLHLHLPKARASLPSPWATAHCST